MSKIEYISGAIATEFSATDGSKLVSIPCSNLAPGCSGMLLVFETREDAINYDPDAEVTRVETDTVEVKDDEAMCNV